MIIIIIKLALMYCIKHKRQNKSEQVFFIKMFSKEKINKEHKKIEKLNNNKRKRNKRA